MVRSPAMLSGYYLEGSSSLYSPLKDGNWYPTGDRASLDCDGNVIIQGRKDRQVKIQGHRVELDEIEYELESYQEIQEAAVVFDEDKKNLIAFIVLNSNLSKITDTSVIEQRCKASLPLIMCPQYYYYLSQISRTPSGKKDRKSLLEIQKTHKGDFSRGVACEKRN